MWHTWMVRVLSFSYVLFSLMHICLFQALSTYASDCIINSWQIADFAEALVNPTAYISKLKKAEEMMKSLMDEEGEEKAESKCKLAEVYLKLDSLIQFFFWSKFTWISAGISSEEIVNKHSSQQTSEQKWGQFTEKSSKPKVNAGQRWDIYELIGEW